MSPIFNRQRRIGFGGSACRGSAVLIVLTMMAITLALAYAVLRSEGMAIQVQKNNNRRVGCKNAAQTGLQVALRKICTSTWTVGTVYNTALNATDSFSVSFATGDSSLTSSSPNYSEYPYRVTITSVGTTIDPSNSNIKSSHTIQAVVKLIPRAVQAEPSDWTQMLNYTAYQFNNDAVEIEPATRLEGRVRIQGAMSLCTGPGWNNPTRSRWLSDIYPMLLNGYSDYRPFNAALDIDFNSTDSATRGLLSTQLGLTLNNVADVNTSSSWNFPTSLTTYQLFRGGKTYSVPTVSGTLSNTTLAPNPLTNPLGIFYCSGNLTLGNNVSIQGTLVVSGSLTLSGTSIALQAYNGLTLDGATTPVQLPAVVSSGKLEVLSTATGSITGAAVVFDEYKIDTRAQASAFPLLGRLMAKKLTFQTRSEWKSFSNFSWNAIFSLFNSQLSNAVPVPFFPIYAWLWNLDPTTQVTVKPETSPAIYHWHQVGNPVFVPGSSDGTNLLWDLQSCVDLP